MLQLSGPLVHRPPQQEDVQSTQELFRGGMPKETCTFRKATDESNEQFSSIRSLCVLHCLHGRHVFCDSTFVAVWCVDALQALSCSSMWAFKSKETDAAKKQQSKRHASWLLLFLLMCTSERIGMTLKDFTRFLHLLHLLSCYPCLLIGYGMIDTKDVHGRVSSPARCAQLWGPK